MKKQINNGQSNIHLHPFYYVTQKTMAEKLEDCADNDQGPPEQGRSADALESSDAVRNILLLYFVYLCHRSGLQYITMSKSSNHRELYTNHKPYNLAFSQLLLCSNEG